jgi:release factor glutamine methyltransferase
VPEARAGRASGATRAEALEAATEAFRAAGIPEPRIDAEVLLSGVSGVGRAELVALPGERLDPASSRAFGEAVRRRLRREPVAYVLGRRGFRRIELEGDPRVLIPRPESEDLVEFALEVGPTRVLEIGTGSGAVALAIADEIPDCRIVATDLSAEALEVARGNAARLGFGDRVSFLEGTWPSDGGRFDLLVANLPYVDREREGPDLAPEVADWEPEIALYGGGGGTEVIASVLAALPASGVVVDRLALEVGQGQAGPVADLVREAGFSAVEVRPDLAGIERVVVGRETSGPA